MTSNTSKQIKIILLIFYHAYPCLVIFIWGDIITMLSLPTNHGNIAVKDKQLSQVFNRSGWPVIT